MTISPTPHPFPLLAAADWDEAERMGALERYAILDTPTEPDFDDIARLLATTFSAPIAVVNLIASDRQWFKAEVGIGTRELPLDVSICIHAILRQDLLVVADTRNDTRFAANPLVTAEDGLRFYAGAVLRTPEGLPIGTVCVLDRKPRPEAITPQQRLTLEVLARQVMTQLELRRAIAVRDMRSAALHAETRERKAAEASLRELNATLDARVTEAIRGREAAQEALRQSQKLEAIGQLTGGVAHDFNNLLTVIRGSVDLLRRADLSPEKRTRYIDAIGETADRAAKVTGQLLAFARRQALKPTLFEVGRSLGEIVDMLGTLSGARIAVEARVPDEPFHVLADRAQFDTAIVNIGINARDAMNGEGRLVVSVAAVSGIPALRSHAPVTGDFIAISISDTGSGIGEDDLDRIFEPFFTTKGVGEGTGLGLSQVIGFAKQSGGDVQVQSVPGQGTTFTLYIPRATDVPKLPADVPENGREAAPGEGACVLVVEDNVQVGAFATQALRELGYDSVMAPDAAHAMAELAKDDGRFQIVFSDVVMPGMSGLELGAEIRRHYPDLPVILASGYSHVLAQSGQQDFELLHKPYSVDQLACALHKAIGNRCRHS